MQVSEVTRNRSTIIVPAGNADGEGWASFRDILAEINEGLLLLAPDENRSIDFQVCTLGMFIACWVKK